MFLRLTAVFCLVACVFCGPALAQWTTYQGNNSHDGYVPVWLDPATFSVLWQRTLPTTSLNPVAAANGQVFVSTSGYFSSGMQLHALDAATGQTQWSKDYGPVYSVNPPAYADGVVYIQTGKPTSGSPYLWAYNANTGAQLFSVTFSAQWERYLAPTISDNTVYINGGYYGGMYAFDALTGQQRWFAGLAQYDGWTPAVDADYAYANTGNYVRAINRSTGQMAFQITDPNFDWNGWSMNQALVLGSRKNAFAINNNRLVCFDLQNRNVKWQLTRSFGNSGQATVANGVVYAIDGGILDAVDEISGDLLWTWSPPAESLSGTIIATNTHVLVSSPSATYAVDLNSHSTAWTYPAGGKLALSNRALYIANPNGNLVSVAIPPSSLCPVTPSDLSIEILSPTTDPAYVSNMMSVNLSGIANELDSSGVVVGRGSLASVTWSNNRGGNGVGFYDSTWSTPTAWSVRDIALQPGDNFITVEAVDLWGNTATAVATLTAPTGLSIAISSPTNEPTYLASTTPINLSGTASSIYSSGTVMDTAALVSLTWSNNRGGSGAGTYGSSSVAPTTWSIAGITLQPGDNEITITASDLWGNTADAAITLSAPTGLSIAILDPTSGPTHQTNGTPIGLSGSACGVYSADVTSNSAGLASVTWSNNRGGSGSGSYSSLSGGPTTWSIPAVALSGGDNVITVAATDLWGNHATAVITVSWMPGSVGAAKKQPGGTMVYVDNAIVTATNVGSGSVFVESADRSSGVRLLTNQSLNIGNEVSFSGTVGRVDGEYRISNVNFLTVESANPLAPIFLNSNWIGNDRTQSLNYSGLNITGLLVRTFGKVTGTISTQGVFYLDDGGRYQDGIGPVRGLRVHVPVGVTIPQSGKMVAVTGISRVQKFTLTGWAEVNGDWYPSGTVLYVPSIWVRGAGDIQVVPIAQW